MNEEAYSLRATKIQGQAPLILVVDDLEVNRYVLSRHLGEAGYRVIEGSTGEDALRMSKELPDLILLDVNLPDFDGYDICAQIKATDLCSRIPVILTSASFTSHEDHVKGIHGGADAYLITPTNPLILLSTIKAWLRVRSTDRERNLLLEEREKLVSKLEINQKQLGLALEAGHIGSWQVDLLTGEVTGSVQFSSIFGDSGVLGNFSAFVERHVHQEDKKEFLRVWLDAVQTHRPYFHQFRIKRPDGSIRWVESKGQSSPEDSDGTSFFTGLSIDITDKKEKLMSLELEYQQLQDFFMQAPVPMVILLGKDHKFVVANEPYEKLVGRKVVNKTLREAFTAQEVGHFIPLLDGVYNSGVSYIGNELPLNILNQDGVLESHFVNLGYHPLREKNGTIKGILAVVQDVTELVRSRKLVEEIANAMPQIVWTAQADGHLDWYNDRWYEFTGMSRGTRWDDEETAMHPEDIEPIRIRWLAAVSAGTPYESKFRLKNETDGIYRWFLVRAVPIRDESGAVTKWIGSTTDINEHQQLVAELEIERDLRERFVATLSHDLRTPLTTARMSAELLLRYPMDVEGVLKNATKIVKQIVRTDIMIRDLLDANRIRAGETLPLTMESFELTRVVFDTLEELTSVYGDRFKINAPEKIDGHWCKNAVMRILENLCSNAVKYGDLKPITISVIREENFIHLEVHNEGRPISLSDQTTLFSPYRRSSTADSSVHKGWGLGLTLVKGLVEAHRGLIEVQSSLDLGTIFIVILPLDSRGHPSEAAPTD